MMKQLPSFDDAQDIQLFLISFVELNIDIESLEITSLAMLEAYRNNNLMPIAEHINAFIGRLNKAGIKHHQPYYALENLSTNQASFICFLSLP